MRDRSTFAKTTIFVLLISALTIPAITRQAYSQATAMHVDPAVNTAEPGNPVFVNVNITGVLDPGVNLWQVTLKYDTSILTITDPLVDIYEGPFLSDIGPTAFQRSVSPLGTTVGCYFTTPLMAATGDGVLFSVLFKVVGPGLTSINIVDTILHDAGGNDILHDLTNGTFYTDTPKADFTVNYKNSTLRNPIVGESITFNATRDAVLGRGSYDPNGEITSYLWDFGDGVRQAFVKDVNLTSVTTHTYTLAGSYPVNLTVADNATSPLTNTKLTDLTVSQRDIAVTKIKMTPGVAMPGTTVNINVTVTNLGTVAEYFNVTLFYDSTLIYYNKTVDPEVGIRSAFCLSLEDDPNSPGMKRSAVLPGQSFTVPFMWNTTGIPEATYTIRANASVTVSASMFYKFFEGVESNYTNNEKQGTFIVTLNPKNVAVTNIALSPKVIEVGHEPVLINVTAQNEGTFNEVVNVAVFYNLTLIENRTDVSLPQLTTAVLTFTWNTASLPNGTYTILANMSTVPDEMDLTDNEGTYTGYPISYAPIASFIYVPAAPRTYNSIAFNATQSHDPDGAIQKYYWDFDDGKNETGSPTPSHTYLVAKTYNVKLIVTDNAPLNGTVLIQIVVNKTFSPVSISTSSNAVTYGNNVKINGFLKPERPQLDVLIMYRLQGELTWNDLAVTETNASGYYTHTWTPPAAKIYEIRSVWPGDAGTFANQSLTAAITVNKATSRISSSVSPQIVPVGSEVTVSGAITPARTGVTVTIQTRPQGGTETTVGTAVTDSSGAYSLAWAPQEKGTFELRATWSGDDNTNGSESGWETVTIREAPTDSTMYYLAAGMVVAAVIAVAAVYFLRIRKR
jgi:PKD repeat protein